MRIALIDYGAGNLNSVRKAFAHLGANVTTPAGPDDLAACPAIVVPGVGNFKATSALDGPWRGAIVALVEQGRPLLGICLGLQWLFEGSTEAPDMPGLGRFRGMCTRLGANAAPPASGLQPLASDPLKIPHVGWNALHATRRSWLLDGVAEGAQVYFTHSYAAPVGPECIATTTYGSTFAAVVEHDRCCGVQFHPEKSGEVGLMILGNFLKRAQQVAFRFL